MKFIKHLSIYVVCAMLVFLPMSCSGPLPQVDGQIMITEIQKQQAEGFLSPELASFLIGEIQKRMDPDSSGIDWESAMQSAGSVLIAAASAYAGVRVVRGPATKLNKSQADALREMLASYVAQKIAPPSPARPSAPPRDGSV